jgi:enamine deaminase RidA (YjgF/YER057c/UK114 family)
MLEKIIPDDIMTPFNNAYSHGVVIPPGAKILHIAGQIGMGPDGTIGEGIEEQADRAWQNVMAILGAADMGPGDLVKVNVYMINENDFPAFAAARTRYIGDARPASTAVFVRQLVDKDWLVEIDAVAAK